MIKFTDFYESYKFLDKHEMCKNAEGYSKFDECLGIDVVKVNPKTNKIDDNKELNTKAEIWLEFGGWCEECNAPYDDIDLYSDGDTFEKAIINLANLVWKKYGYSKEVVIND